MAAVKLSDLLKGARFTLRIGTIEITEILKDEIVARFLVDGKPIGHEYRDSKSDLKFFINTHKKK
jgi:hypothetical protein